MNKSIDEIKKYLKPLTKSQSLLFGLIIKLSQEKNVLLKTGTLTKHYNKMRIRRKLKIVSKDRVSRIISELEKKNQIETKIISTGYYGRTRYITAIH